MKIYKELRDELALDRSECVEVMQGMQDEKEDFEAANFRFIHKDEIDKIQQEELLSDEYTLGAFTPWFIADILEIPTEEVERIQKADGYTALGILMSKKIEEVQQEYLRHDGYGHHFGHYDGNEYEIGDYFAFRIN